MPSRNTYHLTWVSLTLVVRYLFMAAPAKCRHCSLPWTKLPLLTLNVEYLLSAYFCLFSESNSVMSDFLWPHGLYSPWNSPGQNMRVGSHSLFQGIFPTQGFNPGLSHCRQILYQLSHRRSPRKLEWVAYPLSSGTSWPRNRTGVSCIAGGFFTNWAMREDLIIRQVVNNLQELSLLFHFTLRCKPG